MPRLCVETGLPQSSHNLRLRPGHITGRVDRFGEKKKEGQYSSEYSVCH